LSRSCCRVALALAWALAACTALPAIEIGECGNGVIEPPEDCDGFAVEGGAACLPKGAVGECHLSCSRSAEGPNGCPEGWGCDLSGICRRPSGGFEPPQELEVGSASLLVSADFDADGRADVLSAERPTPAGVTRIQIHYFDALGAPAETRLFPHRIFIPSLSDINGDRSRDLVFTDSSIGVLLGRDDRSMVPETFSSYRISGTSLRTCSVIDQQVQQQTGFVALAELDGVAGVYVSDASNGGLPRLLAALPFSIDALVGDPANGDLIEGSGSPCREVVVAALGQTEFTMLDVCAPGAAGEVLWRPQAPAQVVALDPPEPIAHAPLVVDMNGDGHLDVLVGSAERAFVAYGDGQSLAPAVPLTLAPANAPEPVTTVPMPLAAGDVSGDGVVDFVFDRALVLTSPSLLTPGGTDYETTVVGDQGPFTAAAIADLNANGLLDIIAVSSEYPGIRFFNGTGSTNPVSVDIPTSRPSERLALGDFDGNQVLDVALTQGEANGAAEEVLIAFGSALAPPSPPVAVARLGSVAQLALYTEGNIGHLLLCSDEGSGPERQGALALLVGSGERLPMALYELKTFATDRSVNGALGVRAAGGAFLGVGPGDVLALGIPPAPAAPAIEFWLLPELVRTTGSPTRLAGSLPPEARPLSDVSEIPISLALAAADVDGDARDEALLAMPVMDDEHCALFTSRVERDRVEHLAELVVAEPCAQIQLQPVQADADGRLDVAWLTARADGSEPRVSIFYNDGLGGFSSERRSVAGPPTVSPLAFALLPGSPARGTSLALATPTGVELRAIDLASLALGEPETLLDVQGATGVTAGDLNGDGAFDLAAAVDGNLMILGATLEDAL